MPGSPWVFAGIHIHIFLNTQLSNISHQMSPLFSKYHALRAVSTFALEITPKPATFPFPRNLEIMTKISGKDGFSKISGKDCEMHTHPNFRKFYISSYF